MKKMLAISLTVVLLASLCATIGFAESSMTSVQSFRPVTTFPVPEGGVAEILTATPDGNKMLYTNSSDQNIGIIDISNPLKPKLLTTIEVAGEPSSVAVSPDGSMAAAVVITSLKEEGEKPVITPGKLVFIDLMTNTVKAELAIGNHPDSISFAQVDGKLKAVIAIENEPVVVDAEGLLTDEEEPGKSGDISGVGYMQIVTINTSEPAQSTIKDLKLDELQLRYAGLLFTNDPQPEFVDIKNGKVAVSLQENNGIVIINLANDLIERVFSTGYVFHQIADLEDNSDIVFANTYPKDVSEEPYAGARMPDAIAWNADGTVLLTADEGELDYTGGRGWSAWSASGTQVWNDKGSLEQEAAWHGYYPDGRSDKKGIEVEGVETGRFGSNEFAFMGSERGSFVGVYNINDPLTPKLVQLLPTGMAPEGLLAIPHRNLFVTSDEASGTLTFFEGFSGMYEAPVGQPMLKAASKNDFFSAMSGLASHATDSSILYAVPDVAMQPDIYQIDLDGGKAVVSKKATVMENGKPAPIDMEGIAWDTSIAAGANPGFWVASEGNAKYGKADYKQNLLLQVDGDGNVLQKVMLPAEVDAAEGGMIRNNGFEGVTISTDGKYLLAAVQRSYAKDEKVNDRSYARIGRYDITAKAWEFFLYPLENTATEGDWIGLSEIVNVGYDLYAVIERDKQVGGAIGLKAVYTFTLDGLKSFNGLTTATSDLSKSLITKQQVLDLRSTFAPYEKIEGLAVTPNGQVWAALDNDGGEVEPRLSAVGLLQNMVK